MGVTLTPAERQSIEQRPSTNAIALLAYSRGVRDEARGQYEAAAQNFRAAVAADPSFGVARQRLQSVQTQQQTIADNTTAGAGAAADAPKTTATTSTQPASAPSSVGSGAAAAAAGAINPSPAGTIGTTTTASTTQQQQQNQDKGTQTVRQPVFATVVIKVTQLP